MRQSTESKHKTLCRADPVCRRGGISNYLYAAKRSYFVWPEKEDIAFTDIDDIHLSMSLVDRRQHYRFEDVEMEQMKNCCH